jgi:hypothetical protein
MDAKKKITTMAQFNLSADFDPLIENDGVEAQV